MKGVPVRPIHVAAHTVTFVGDLPSPLQRVSVEVAEVEDDPADDLCVVSIPGDGAMFYLWGRRNDVLSVARSIRDDLRELEMPQPLGRHAKPSS